MTHKSSLEIHAFILGDLSLMPLSNVGNAGNAGIGGNAGNAGNVGVPVGHELVY